MPLPLSHLGLVPHSSAAGSKTQVALLSHQPRQVENQSGRYGHNERYNLSHKDNACLLKLAIQLRRPFTEECKPVSYSNGRRQVPTSTATQVQRESKLEDSPEDGLPEGSKDV